jgi:hypothetical protein
MTKYPPLKGQWFKKIKEAYYIMDDSNVIDGQLRPGEWMWIANVFSDHSVRFAHIKRPPLERGDFLWIQTMGADYKPTVQDMGGVIMGIFEQDIDL